MPTRYIKALFNNADKIIGIAANKTELDGLVANKTDIDGLVAEKSTIDGLVTQSNYIDDVITLNGTAPENTTVTKIAKGFYEFSNLTFEIAVADVNYSSNYITHASHGLVTGDAVIFTSTDTVPGGLTADTPYYVIKVDDNKFEVATTRANAKAGTKIDIINAGVGTHTLKANVLGEIYLGVTLPTNSVIVRSYYKVGTTFTDGGDDDTTIALQIATANDITTATAISAGGNIWDAGAYVAGAQDNTVTNILKLTAEKDLIMKVAVDDITAGKIYVYLEYFEG